AGDKPTARFSSGTGSFVSSAAPWSGHQPPSCAAEGAVMDLHNEEDRGGHEHHHDHDHHGHDEHCEVRVKVPFNNQEVFLHKGVYEVETIKRLAGIQLTDDLDQLIGSKIVPLPDDGKNVHIEGCEIFLHHPKDGGSS